MKRAVLAATFLISLVLRDSYPDSLLDTGYIPGVGPMPRRQSAMPTQSGETGTAETLAPAGTDTVDPAETTPTDSLADAGNAVETAESSETAGETDGGQIVAARPSLSKTGPQPVAHEGTYARSETSGVFIAGQKTWYLEEFDAFERPSVGTTWVDGSVAKTVSWKYYGDTQIVRERLESDEKGTVLAEYDRSARVLALVSKDADGNELSSTKNEYGEGGRLSETVNREGKRIKRTTYVYREDGSLLEKRGYLNGSLEIVYRWKDEDNWTETVYNKGKAALVATYVDGVRRKETDAKKK